MKVGLISAAVFIVAVIVLEVVAKILEWKQENETEGMYCDTSRNIEFVQYVFILFALMSIMIAGGNRT